MSEPEIRETDFVFKAASVPTARRKSLDEIEKAHILRTLETVAGTKLGQPISRH